MKTDEVKRMKPKQEQIKEMANAVVRSAVASKAKQEKSLKINNEVLFIKNKEKYAKEIVEMALNDNPFGFHKDLNKIIPCSGIQCQKCLFHGPRLCSITRREWANAEYEEPEQVKETEKEILKVLPVIESIEREKDGD